MSIDRRDDFGTPRHRFTSGEYLGMVEAGVLDGVRCELIDGEVLDMSPSRGRHSGVITELMRAYFQGGASGCSTALSQCTLRLSDTWAPEPDFMLLTPMMPVHDPGASEVLLIVEVCDSSYHRDLTLKVPAYGSAGIPEVWLVNIDGGTLETFGDLSDGDYRRVRKWHADDAVTASQVPSFVVRVGDLLAR